MLGLSYDWDREVNTTDPKYYKWTQWIFLQLYNKGLAYEAEVPVNWCPELKAVLSNEEVVDGKSDIGGHPVERLPMRQWMRLHSVFEAATLWYFAAAPKRCIPTGSWRLLSSKH